MIARTIETKTHGRYLVEPASVRTSPMLVGFHGYAELAEHALDRLRAIGGADGWTLVAIQGLNRFYQRRTNDVIAGWMTRQDRELAVADNVAYVRAVVDAAAREWPDAAPLVFSGFSQGVAMAFRAAATSSRPVGGVIAAGGDVPPEIPPHALGRIGRVLLCRGRSDDWYTTEKFTADFDRLRGAGVATHALEFDGGHEWSDAVLRASADLLKELHP
jgi:predicted esterase